MTRPRSSPAGDTVHDMSQMHAKQPVLAATALLALTLVAPAALCAEPQRIEQPSAGIGLLDAVRATLSTQPDIQLLERQVDVAEGNRQVALGQFDTAFELSLDRVRDAQPLSPAEESIAGISDAVANITSYGISAQKQLRSGLIIGPQVSFSRQDLSLGSVPSNRGTVTFGILQPLGRGRGADVVAAPETAAGLEVDATRLDLQHVASAAVLRTALAYWDYVAAWRQREIVGASEARFETLVAETQTLIDADAQPAADLKQVQASLAEKVSQRLLVEQGLFGVRHALGLAIGIPYEEITALPPPTDPMPDIPDEAVTLNGERTLVDLALDRRADLQASRQRNDLTDVLVLEARDALKPRVDLQARFGYAGLDEGGGFGRFFTPLIGSGVNAAVGLVYEWPPSNNVALGTAATTEASHRQGLIRTDDLRRSVGSAVAVAYNDVWISRERVGRVRQAGALYESALDDERQKLQLGLSTIIDVILTEERWTASLLDAVSAERDYAQALLRLRFETGSLLDRDGQGYVVDADALTTIPPIGRRP